MNYLHLPKACKLLIRKNLTSMAYSYLITLKKGLFLVFTRVKVLKDKKKNVLSYLFYFSKEQIFPLKNNS